MLRNRILISGTKQLQLTLGSYSYSATPASGSTTVYAYYGGVPITDLTSSMVSKSGNMSSVSVNSSGRITMSYAKNTSTTSTKTSTMTLTYQGQTKTFTITQAKDYVTNTTTSDKKDVSGTTGTSYSTISLTDNGDGTSTATSNMTFSYTLDNITITKTTYASGTTQTSQKVNSSTSKTCTLPKKYLKFNQSKTGAYALIGISGYEDMSDYYISTITVNSQARIDISFVGIDEFYTIMISSDSWVTNPTSVKIKIVKQYDSF